MNDPASQQFFPAEIMLVEDNPGDVLLAQKALDRARLANNMHIAIDGEQALEYLRSQSKNSLPDLILMDVNLPGMSGTDVLNEIKIDPALSHIAVIVLAGSSAEIEVIKDAQHGADQYLIKPINFEKLTAAIAQLKNTPFNIMITSNHGKA